jgi:hypothetical protein
MRSPGCAVSELRRRWPRAAPGARAARRTLPHLRGTIEHLWAVHAEPPPLIGLVRGVPPVAYVNPFSRLGLRLREQRQQARRGEP